MTDHNSSPRAVAEPAIDIADMYAFPSPSRPAQLVLAMTVFPNARPGALFSDAAEYRFRLRPVTIPAGGPAPRFDVGTDEYDVTCTFTAPVGTDDAGQSVQGGTCTLPNGATVTFRVGDEQAAEVSGAGSMRRAAHGPALHRRRRVHQDARHQDRRLPGGRHQLGRGLEGPGHRR